MGDLTKHATPAKRATLVNRVTFLKLATLFVGLFLMCAGMLAAAPQQAFADSHYPSASDIYLGGVCYTSAHPDTASYDESTGVLTLNCYKGGGIYVSSAADEAMLLTINLIGNSVIDCTGESDYDAGIEMTGPGRDVEITSSKPATLTINALYDEERETLIGGVFVSRNLSVTGQATLSVTALSYSSKAVYIRGISVSHGFVAVKDHAGLNVRVQATKSESCFGIEGYGDVPVLAATTDQPLYVGCYSDDGTTTFGVHVQHVSSPFVFSGLPQLTVVADYVWTPNYNGGTNPQVAGYEFTEVGVGRYSYDLPTGWNKVGPKWRYYLGGGQFVRNDFRTDKNKSYYFGDDAFMVTGWKKIDGTWYYFAKSGAMQLGWLNDGGTWYYLNPIGGAMLTGWQQVKGTWYYLDKKSGAMLTGWQRIGGSWYYLDKKSGAMQKGWLKSGGTWYYLASNGKMVTGWAKISNKYYYFASSGAMQTGWLKYGGKWYYLQDSGAMATGWLQISGTWYYFNSSGAWVE